MPIMTDTGKTDIFPVERKITSGNSFGIRTRNSPCKKPQRQKPAISMAVASVLIRAGISI